MHEQWGLKSILAILAMLLPMAAGLLASASAASLPREIEDPQCLGINKEPWHATLMPYANMQEALAANRHASSFCCSLNGPWKFNWVKRPELRPVEFYKPDFDVSAWKDIPVPSNWQVLGYGTPYYRNNGYIFQRDFPHVMSDAPKDWTAYDERNPVGSYRREFEVPASWGNRRVFLTFDGVDSAFFLWINGQKVGYSINSRNAAEFDITKYIKPGKNLVAVEVYRFSAGSFLEDQDMWRLSGIFRNVTLWSAPAIHIRDFFVETDLDAQYRDATVEVTAKVKNYKPDAGIEQIVTARLFDSRRGPVAEASGRIGKFAPAQEQVITLKIPVTNPSKWTAETPNLYTLVLMTGPGDQRQPAPAEILSARVGFRKVEIKGRQFLVNGTPVKLKGANRHEHWPEVGHAITEAQMIRDLEVLKQGNCNHVRTCHYSDDPRWYELCDEWGIWLVAEANCECHGYDGRFDNEPRMRAAIIDRSVANVENFKNHPSVVIWSLGNECGGRGKNFIDAMNTIKAIDSTRPVHYERFGMGKGNPSDFDQKMYGTPAEFARIAKDKSLTKPFYICEFAHAMFNSMGSLAEYSDVLDRYPEIAGGAIWEWQDQSLWNRRDPKHPILAYGGGFGEVPNDHYFIHKGVVAGDRSPKPHYAEMKRAYQWIGIEAANLAAGTVKIKNKYQFIDLSGFDAAWTLSQDGVEIQQGTLAMPAIIPGAEATVAIPFRKIQSKPGAEYFLRVAFTLANDQHWAKKGYEVAAAQFQLPVSAPAAVATATRPVSLTQDDKAVTVAGDGFAVIFDKAAGTISALNRDGVNVLAADGGPRLHLWRAPHRNDDMWAYDEWVRYGLDNLKFSVVSFAASQESPNIVRVVAEIKAEGKNGFSATHTAKYTISGDGAIAVDNDVKFAGRRIPLARLGVRLLLDKRLDRLNFLGRGPMENYADRKRGFDVGLYSTGVNEQYAYEKPMERANHEDIRWAALTGAGLPGLLAQADGDLLQASALPHTDEQMTPVEYKIDLPASEATVLCLSAKTLGVGSNGCGPRPLAKYIVWSTPARFAYVLRLLPVGQKPTPELGRLPSPAPPRPATSTVTRRTDHSRWRVVSCTSFQEGEGEPEQAIDGDPSTYWHSRWKTNPTRNPHALVIDFGTPLKIGAVVYSAREDMENGRVKAYEIFFSVDGKTWGRPAAAGRFENFSDEEQQATLVRPVAARFMKFVVKSEVHGNTFAAIAELDIVPAK
jgi:beta-galactosidase